MTFHAAHVYEPNPLRRHLARIKHTSLAHLPQCNIFLLFNLSTLMRVLLSHSFQSEKGGTGSYWVVISGCGWCWVVLGVGMGCCSLFGVGVARVSVLFGVGWVGGCWVFVGWFWVVRLCLSSCPPSLIVFVSLGMVAFSPHLSLLLRSHKLPRGTIMNYDMVW